MVFVGDWFVMTRLRLGEMSEMQIRLEELQPANDICHERQVYEYDVVIVGH